MAPLRTTPKISYGTRVQLAPGLETDRAWSFYHRIFTPLAKLAVNRHLLHRSEFDQIMTDTRIEKHTAVDDAGRIRGLAVVTNDLAAWPLVSPEYFAANHPREYADGAIWYVGFVGASANGLAAFKGLLESMTAGRRNGGLFFMDFCSMNVKRGIVKLCESRLGEIDGRVQMTRVDEQSFWLTTFGAEV